MFFHAVGPTEARSVEMPDAWQLTDDVGTVYGPGLLGKRSGGPGWYVFDVRFERAPADRAPRLTLSAAGQSIEVQLAR